MREDRKFIKLCERTSAPAKTKVWEVVNTLTEETLGMVKWSTGWRRYVFEPEDCTQYDSSCLSHLAIFCLSETNEHKRNRSRKRKIK